MAQFSIGDTVSFVMFGIERTGRIVRIHAAASGTCRVMYSNEKHTGLFATVKLEHLRLVSHGGE